MSLPRPLLPLAGAILFVWLCPDPAPAQPVPPVGTDSTLDAATWNITWFGAASNGPSDDARQLDHVRRVLSESAVDLWAVQEIADPADFDALLVALGPRYAGQLAWISGTQRVGFVYDTAVLEPRGTPSFRHILTSESADFAGRPPLRFDARVAFADTAFEATFITLHMKAFADASSYLKRARASQALKAYLDAELPDRPVVVLGDFNDLINSSIRAGESSPYLNFLQDPFDYRIVTRGFEASGRVTFCSNNACTAGSAIDHVLITDELFAHVEAGSVGRMTELPALFPAYPSTTSDHLPVHARFRRLAPVASPVVAETLPPAGPTLDAYPNPFGASTTLALRLPAPGPFEVRVFDLLGREVRRWRGVGAAGPVRLDFDAAALPAGTYLATLETAGRRTVHRLVRTR